MPSTAANADKREPADGEIDRRLRRLAAPMSPQDAKQHQRQEQHFFGVEKNAGELTEDELLRREVRHEQQIERIRRRARK